MNRLLSGAGPIILHIIAAKNIAVGSEEVYASTGTSVMIYNKEFAELKKTVTNKWSYRNRNKHNCLVRRE